MRSKRRYSACCAAQDPMLCDPRLGQERRWTAPAELLPKVFFARGRRAIFDREETRA
jgi:hypothetical protein